jgi:hypothetical protein
VLTTIEHKDGPTVRPGFARLDSRGRLSLHDSEPA